MLSKSQVKYIQSLAHKKSRDEERVFVAEGPKIVEDFLWHGNVKVKQIYAVRSWLDANRKNTGSIELTEITEQELERLSQLKTPNQVLAVVEKFDVPDKIELKNKISIVLDTIQDPGNLGTIIRIADWFGVKNIICSNDCADMYNSKVVQATMGSIARANVFYKDLLPWLKEQSGIKIYATALNGNAVHDFGKIQEGIIIIGNESKGINDSILQMADEKISILRIGDAESLNAAVATGIILSHIC
jgi:RNA methyltransferase, TrmH family